MGKLRGLVMVATAAAATAAFASCGGDDSNGATPGCKDGGACTGEGGGADVDTRPHRDAGFVPPDAGSGCERFHIVASGTACPMSGCPAITCGCEGPDAANAFPQSLTACTSDGCMISIECPTSCAEDLGPALQCTGTHVVESACLAPHGPFAVGSGPYELQVGDLDGDGHADAIVSCMQANAVNVLLGDGAGGFAAAQSFGGIAAEGLALGDVDGDHDLDVAGIGQGLVVFLNDGTGKLAPQPPLSPGKLPINDVAAGDLDGDGDLDFVLATSADVAVTTMMNDGKGKLTKGGVYPTGPAGKDDEPQRVAVADLDGDGALDVVTAQSADAVGVLFNVGGGKLGAQTELAAGRIVSDIALGDLDGNGAVDIVAATGSNGDDGSITVFYGLGDSFSAPYVYMAGHIAIRIELADVDGDGHLDVVAAAGGTVTVAFNVGNGALGPQASYALPKAQTVGVGDVNGDGKPDVLATSESSGAIVTAFTNGCTTH